MAIVKEEVEQKISNVLSKIKDLDAANGEKEFISGIAEVIIDTIKSADIKIESGLIIVQGSATTQTNVAPIEIIKGLS